MSAPSSTIPFGWIKNESDIFRNSKILFKNIYIYKERTVKFIDLLNVSSLYKSRCKKASITAPTNWSDKKVRGSRSAQQQVQPAVMKKNHTHA